MASASGALGDGTFSGILDRQGGGDDEYLAHAAEAVGFEHHPAEPGIDRQPGQPAADRGERADAGWVDWADRRQLLQQQVAVADGSGVWRLDEREGRDVAETDRRHLQDDRRQVGAQDLRFGELRAGLELLLAVQADARARSDAPAPPGTLVRRRLRHRLDRQPLDLQAAAEAGDPGSAGVDDVAHTGHGERRLGDVRAEHDAPATMRLEDAVLLRRGQSGVQRQHLGVAALEAAQRIGGVVDLALPGEEHEHVAWPLLFEFGDGIDDCLHLIPVVARSFAEGSVANFDRERASRHLDHRRVDTAGGEVAGEAGGVDRRRGHDHGQIGPLGQQPAQVAEDEVDVEIALVGLVDDQRVVAAEHAVALDLGEQDAVGHHAHDRLVADTVVEAHRVPDGGADGRVELAGEALGDRAGGDAPRLGVTDQPGDAPSDFDAQLRQLGALARAGLPGDDHDSVVAAARPAARRARP